MIKNKAQETEETFSRYRYINNFAPRIYNGLMPSSTYPGFSGSRVNLIE